MRYQLCIRRPVEFIGALVDHLDSDIRISLEGDLSQCDFRGLRVMARDPIGVFVRNTRYPETGFVVLEVLPQDLSALQQGILPRAGLRSRIYHLMIEQSGVIVFAAYDAFSRDSVWVDSRVGQHFLDLQVGRRTLKGYRQAAD